MLLHDSLWNCLCFTEEIEVWENFYWLKNTLDTLSRRAVASFLYNFSWQVTWLNVASCCFYNWSKNLRKHLILSLLVFNWSYLLPLVCVRRIRLWFFAEPSMPKGQTTLRLIIICISFMYVSLIQLHSLWAILQGTHFARFLIFGRSRMNLRVCGFLLAFWSSRAFKSLFFSSGKLNYQIIVKNCFVIQRFAKITQFNFIVSVYCEI